ncbi:GntR family transcriptional regulator [Neobacillus sp. PS3-12]|uniref:GntR family transcriptional regulator n=1 Tax=Neobacillus sp. PS3-12 TaxID=3070677 RepID=UPI0027DF2268|nr:GntR family transcriptional regulator [Neobacillus sp. PS3-12]WML55149.1 GntR family transcriptional regulator [Neobacillus sp. PS3-12]
MNLSKVKPISLKQQAFESIKNAIIEQSILPGEILYERQLSEMLGISRTPVRESIPLLELEGWVKSVPRKGTFVCNISEKDVEEVIQIRRAIESLVVELLIPAISDKEIEHIEEIYGIQAQLIQDKNKFINTDKDFHIYLAQLSGNVRLSNLMQTISDQLRWFGVRALGAPDRNEHTLKEHAALIDAIKMRDIEEAKKAVITHINRTREAILKNLQL